MKKVQPTETVKPYVIVNPVAGSVGKLNARLKQLGPLDANEVRVTQHAGEAKTLARQAVRAGCKYVIAAGGDGTLNEVINGITASRQRHQVCVGIVPLGTANDFARSIGLTGDVDATIDILRAKMTKGIDLVRMTSERTRYFVNASSGGLDRKSTRLNSSHQII